MMKTGKTIVLFRLRSMETGGVQKVLCDIMRNLPRDHFDVHLLLNIRQGEMLPLIPEHVEVHSLAEGKENFSANSLVNRLQLVIRRARLEFYRRVPGLIKNKIGINPDVEVAFTSTEYAALLKSPFKKSKKVGWFHADIRDAAGTEQQNREIIRQLQKMDNAVFVSHQTRNIIKEIFNEEFPSGTVIYNPFQHSEILEKAVDFKANFETELPVFISLGRLIPRKGNRLLAEAHKILIAKGLQHKIFVFGDGQEKANLQNYLAENRLVETFIIREPVINPYPWLKKADFYVLPSKSEAYPLVIGEALILGKPIVATDAGGVKEMIVNEETGLIVNYNAQDLASAMERYLTDPDLLARIKANIPEGVKKFDNEKIYAQITEILSKK